MEYGTAPHIIAPKSTSTVSISKKALKFGEYYAAKVMHPGTAAYPFMRPAWDETHKQIEAEIAKNLQDILKSNFKGIFK